MGGFRTHEGLLIIDFLRATLGGVGEFWAMSPAMSSRCRFAATMNEVANGNAEELRETMGHWDSISQWIGKIPADVAPGD